MERTTEQTMKGNAKRKWRDILPAISYLGRHGLHEIECKTWTTMSFDYWSDSNFSNEWREN